PRPRPPRGRHRRSLPPRESCAACTPWRTSCQTSVRKMSPLWKRPGSPEDLLDRPRTSSPSGTTRTAFRVRTGSPGMEQRDPPRGERIFTGPMSDVGACPRCGGPVTKPPDEAAGYICAWHGEVPPLQPFRHPDAELLESSARDSREPFWVLWP